MSKVLNGAKSALASHGTAMWSPFETGGFDPTWKAKLLQQCAQVERYAAQHVQLTFVSGGAGRIEIKEADDENNLSNLWA